MTTPYLNMLLPVVSSTVGPTWASELNDALTLIDQHNHTSGRGVQIPTGGILINSDLPLNGYNLTTIRSLMLSDEVAALSGTTDLGNLYRVGDDLYYNDGSGNQIQITSGGGLNAASVGGIGGDYSTSTASLSYSSSSKTFTFTQATNTPAKVDFGSLTLRKVALNGAGITIEAPSGLSAGFTLTLPTALPASSGILSVDSSGVISFAQSITVPLDANVGQDINVTRDVNATGDVNAGGDLNSTGDANIGGDTDIAGALAFGSLPSIDATSANVIGSAMTSTGANAVGSAMTYVGANAIIDDYTRATGSTVAARGVGSASASGMSFSGDVNLHAITGLSVTITTSGRPVLVSLQGNSTNGCTLGVQKYGSGSVSTIGGNFKIYRDGVAITGRGVVLNFPADTSTSHEIDVPLDIQAVDFVAAGTYTYTVYMQNQTTSSRALIDGSTLVVYEL